ncbi:MAG: hypothetical protein U0869_04685 [Chloroflexota bacterium]
MLHGDLGYAIGTSRSIGEQISSRIEPSLLLMVLAALVALAFNLLRASSRSPPVRRQGRLRALGDHRAAHQHAHVRARPDRHLRLRREPRLAARGRAGHDRRKTTSSTGLSRFVLPALILGLVNAGAADRPCAGEHEVESLGADTSTTARSRACPAASSSSATFENALIPVITVLAFLMPKLIASAVVTETVFNWPRASGGSRSRPRRPATRR